MDNSLSSFPKAYQSPVGVMLLIVSIVVFVTGFYWLYLLYKNPNHPQKNLWVVLWALVPPLYFLFNYYVIFRNFGNWTNPEALSHYKYSQGLFTKLWAAVGALYGLSVSGHLSKAEQVSKT